MSYRIVKVTYGDGNEAYEVEKSFGGIANEQWQLDRTLSTEREARDYIASVETLMTRLRTVKREILKP